MTFPGLDNYVKLYDDETRHHEYWSQDGVQYESQSTFMKRFYEPFNAVLISRGDKDLQKQWKDYGQERADIGTKIHNACELYAKEMRILPENEEMRPAIISIVSEYNYAYKSFEEQCLYHTPSLVAGTCDKLILTSSHPNAPVNISDFKTNLGGLPQVDLRKDGSRNHKYMLHCCSHLIESKYNKYSLQLSLYAYFLEQKTGRRIGKLSIHYINPENLMEHYFIPVNYQRSLIKEMLLHKEISDREQKPEPKKETEIFTLEDEVVL